MSTLAQQDFAKRLISALESKGFVTTYNDDQEYADSVSYSKNGVFGPDLYVHQMIIISHADSIEVKEQANDLSDMLAYCEKEISLAQANSNDNQDVLSDLFN